MKSFDQVTRTTQRKWLKQLAEAALRRYGIENAKLRFISESCFMIFRVGTEYDQFVLRVDPEPPIEKWIVMSEGELLWLQALRQDTDLIVPEPVFARDGIGTQIVETKEIPEGRIVTMLRWMPGRHIRKRPSPKLARQLGAFMAQLHIHTETFSLPEKYNRDRTSWSKLEYWQDPQNDTSKLLTVDQRILCAKACERLLLEIEEVGTESDYGLVHADMSLKNCLLQHGQLGVIDFADCRFSSHYYDIAVPLTDFAEYWNTGDQEYERLQAEFYEGYSSVRPLGRRYESAVETFMVARAFDVIEWIHIDWPSLTYFSFGPELLSQSLHRIQNYMRGFNP
jgi:Ser/Thr protein kinase RdoA (MazF antagonist)